MDLIIQFLRVLCEVVYIPPVIVPYRQVDLLHLWLQSSVTPVRKTIEVKGVARLDHWLRFAVESYYALCGIPYSKLLADSDHNALGAVPEEDASLAGPDEYGTMFATVNVDAG